ncbi:MAG: hypothetical protein MKZ95_10800, partial [Pirellulales bacterium]|nr:hypothetical protein [Pirellulales bacterium]
PSALRTCWTAARLRVGLSLAGHSMLSFIASKTLILYQCMDSVKGDRSEAPVDQSHFFRIHYESAGNQNNPVKC